jgi:hypothetical protein
VVAVWGALNGAPVEVRMESARTMSAATQACFPSSAPSRVTVRVPLAAGGAEELSEVILKGLVVGGRALTPFHVGVWKEKGPCVVTLGTDALLPYALQVSPAHRTVTFVASRPVDFYARWGAEETATEDRGVLELTRAPTTDLPLLAVGTGGRAPWVAPFIVSTTLERTVASEEARKRLGSGPLSLSPDLSLASVPVDQAPRWSQPVAVGVLGVDVLGRFDFTLDLGAQRLALARERVNPQAQGDAAVPSAPPVVTVPPAPETSEPQEPP